MFCFGETHHYTEPISTKFKLILKLSVQIGQYGSMDEHELHNNHLKRAVSIYTICLKLLSIFITSCLWDTKASGRIE
jgi:hypothetical protein